MTVTSTTKHLAMSHCHSHGNLFFIIFKSILFDMVFSDPSEIGQNESLLDSLAHASHRFKHSILSDTDRNPTYTDGDDETTSPAI
jgi:hypothetical protein